jgi:hypothetical protein
MVVQAEHRGDFRIHVTFNDGSEGTVDCSNWLKGPVFKPLKDPRYFSRFFVEAGAVAWPNGADIAPETMYEAAISNRSHRVRRASVVRERPPAYRTPARPRRRSSGASRNKR